MIVLISKSIRCLVLFWLNFWLVLEHFLGHFVDIEHALSSISANEIVGVISSETRSLILGHHVFCHERVVKVVHLLWRRLKPHIIETLF